MYGLVEGRQKQKEDVIILDYAVLGYCGQLNSVVDKAV